MSAFREHGKRMVWLSIGVALGTLIVVFSGWLTGLCLGDRSAAGSWTGLALLPQAGVALAMAFTGSQRFPQHSDMPLTVAVASTVIFELVGPLATRLSLARHP